MDSELAPPSVVRISSQAGEVVASTLSCLCGTEQILSDQQNWLPGVPNAPLLLPAQDRE